MPKRNCGAKCRDGHACTQPAMRGQERCKMHGGKSPQAMRKAQERMLANIDEAVVELMRIATSGKSEAVRVAALREWFERAGFGEKKRVEITHINDDVLQQEYERLLTEMAELDN